jgi:8-oxo-dGTP pyrophosphatase MutT (NUDIX family)
MPPQPWKTLNTREIYKNKWMSLHEDIAELPNGHTTIYGVCEFGECVGMLPFLDDQNVLLVRQYRYVHQENHRWEMPTGGIRPGETPEQAAQRELMEEGGYCAGKLDWVSTYHTSKSICHETAYLYIGRNLSPAEAPPDETEFIERATFSFEDALKMVEKSEIRDSMTVIAMLHAARLLEAGKW